MSNQKAIQDQIRTAIGAAKSVLITSAVKPDGDSVAAQLSLRQLILAHNDGNTRIDIVNEAPCPKRYRFLEGANEMRTANDPDLLDRYDVAITVDCSPERVGAVRPRFDGAATKVTIDHHKVSTVGGSEINLVIPTASSTAEIIYEFIKDPAWKTPLTPRLAEIIYTGIIFDTGGFQYQLTTPHTLRVGAELLETGFDFARTAERVLLVKSYASRKVLGKVLTDLKTNRSKQIAYAAVSQRTMQEAGAGTDDLESIVERLIFTEGIEVAILAIDLPDSDEYKLSLRSKGKVDVAALARQLDPQGGGHERAAGCNMKGEVEEIFWQVIAEVEDRLGLTENRTVGLRKS